MIVLTGQDRCNQVRCSKRSHSGAGSSFIPSATRKKAKISSFGFTKSQMECAMKWARQSTSYSPTIACSLTQTPSTRFYQWIPSWSWLWCPTVLEIATLPSKNWLVLNAPSPHRLSWRRRWCRRRATWLVWNPLQRRWWSSWIASSEGHLGWLNFLLMVSWPLGSTSLMTQETDQSLTALSSHRWI